MSGLLDNDGIVDKKFFTGLVLTIIFINIIFVGIFFVYGYKTVNNEYCSVEYLDTDGVGLQTLYTLDSNDDLLTFDTVNHYNNQQYSINDRYCLTANTSSSEPLLLQLLNIDSEVVSDYYLSLNDDSVCFEGLTTPLTVTLLCDNCDSTHTANINGYVTGEDVGYVFDNDGVVTVENNELINQELKIVEHCKKFFNDMVWRWIATHGLLLLIFLIILGLDKLKKVFLDGA